jgi:hypothetical protein
MKEGTKFPLKDGQVVETGYGTEKVMGEIKWEYKEPVCWTLQGNWYRRSDGVQMSAWNGEVMTVRELFKRRRQGKIS